MGRFEAIVLAAALGWDIVEGALQGGEYSSMYSQYVARD